VEVAFGVVIVVVTPVVLVALDVVVGPAGPEVIFGVVVPAEVMALGVVPVHVIPEVMALGVVPVHVIPEVMALGVVPVHVIPQVVALGVVSGGRLVLLGHGDSSPFGSRNSGISM
jgi:hypothetical protein